MGIFDHRSQRRHLWADILQISSHHHDLIKMIFQHQSPVVWYTFGKPMSELLNLVDAVYISPRNWQVGASWNVSFIGRNMRHLTGIMVYAAFPSHGQQWLNHYPEGKKMNWDLVCYSPITSSVFVKWEAEFIAVVLHLNAVEFVQIGSGNV